MIRSILASAPSLAFGIVLLATMVLQAAPVCPENGKCKYYSIYTSPISYLWKTAEGFESIPDSAIKGAFFYTYAPNDTLILNPCSKDYATGKTTCDNSETLSHPTAKVVADSTKGFFYTKASSHYPAENLPLGMAVEANGKPTIFRYYTFYVADLEFSYQNEEGERVVVSPETLISLPVDSSLSVDVRAVIPVGPDSGLTDTTINKYAFYLEPVRGAENLVFTTPAGDTTDRVILEKGIGHFSVRSSSAVSGAQFTASGLVNPSDSSFFVHSTFPGNLTFENPNLPKLDSAFIYDADGDGIGDSIIAYFSGKTDSVSWDSIFYNWPNGGSLKQFAGEYNQNASSTIMELMNVKTSLSKDSGKGDLKVYVTSKLSGSSAPLSSPIVDRIGPVIQKVALISGAGGADDTLVVDFNKDLDTAFEKGAALQLANGDKVFVKAVAKDGNRWTFTVESGMVAVGDSLSLVRGLGDVGLVAADGNVPGFNLPAKVTNSGRVYFSNENNGFFDTDADGKMDSVSVGFENPISEEDLENFRLQFFWKDSAGNVLIIQPETKDLTLSKDGKVVSYKLTEEEIAKVQPNLTSIDNEDEYGYAALENISDVNGDTVSLYQYLQMNDRMAPVITSTFLSPESKNKNSPDKLTLRFSEPVNVSAMTNPNFIGFVMGGDTVYFDFSLADWNDSCTQVSLRLGSEVSLLSRANPNDSLFINPEAKVSDLNGNAVSANTKTTNIVGDPRVLMETVSLVGVDRAALSADGSIFTERFFPAGTSAEKEMGKSLGVMLDVAFATIFDDSTGESLDLEKVGLRWTMDIYTNMGTFVASGSGKVRCDDPGFEGNCFENAKRLYLRWNLLSHDGRKAGVGAYLVQFYVKVYGKKHSFTYDKIFKWGVHGGKHGLTLED